MLRVAVVTPYYKERSEVLLKCHESVLGQTYSCQHFLVADGHPSQIFGNIPNHIILPQANGDNGNTPRAIGGILADSYGYDAVAYLDADNWYEPTHIANLVAAYERNRTPLVCSKRLFCDMEGRMLAITEPAEDANRHVDTSSWLVFRPAFALLSAWLMPKVLGPFCDRIFLLKAIHDRFRITFLDVRTVVFRTSYVLHYRAAGLPAPVGAKGWEEFNETKAHLSNPAVIAELVAKLGFYVTEELEARPETFVRRLLRKCLDASSFSVAVPSRVEG